MPPSAISARTTTPSDAAAGARKTSGASALCAEVAEPARGSSSGQPKAIAPATEASAAASRPSAASNRPARPARHRRDRSRRLTPRPADVVDGQRRATSSTVSHGSGARILATCGANTGDGHHDVAGRAVGHDLAVGQHDDAVGDRRHELDVVGGQQHGVARRRRARAAIADQAALGRVVEAAGGLVEQHDTRASARSWTARTRASRWPSERSRGCAASVDAGDEPVEQRRGGPGRSAGLVVGLAHSAPTVSR